MPKHLRKPSETNKVWAKKILSKCLDRDKRLLAECVEAYLPLAVKKQLLLEQLQSVPSPKGVKAMNLTTREKAFKEGRAEGKAELVLILLNKKFGTVSDEQLKQFLMKNGDDLFAISERIFEARSLEEVLGS